MGARKERGGERKTKGEGKEKASRAHHQSDENSRTKRSQQDSQVFGDYPEDERDDL